MFFVQICILFTILTRGRYNLKPAEQIWIKGKKCGERICICYYLVINAWHFNNFECQWKKIQRCECWGRFISNRNVQNISCNSAPFYLVTHKQHLERLAVNYFTLRKPRHVSCLFQHPYEQFTVLAAKGA